MKEKSLIDKQQEIFDWCKSEYEAEFNEDLLALIIDRIMQNEREAMSRLKENGIELKGESGKYVSFQIIDRIFGKELGGEE